jgi:predicted RNA-binding protein with PIN domain
VWQWPRRRGVAGEPGLTDPEPAPAAGVSGALLRSALELAWVVAREDQESAPRALRRIVRFASLPPAALAKVRRVVEEDEAFRARVADAAVLAENVLGRAGWLWLVRPDGWEHELVVLDELAEQTAASTREEHDERSARRRLAAAEDAKQRAEATAAAAGAAATRAGEDLTAERVARRAAETRAVTTEAEVGRLHRRLQSAEQAVAAMEAALADVQAAETAMRAERDRLAALVADLEADLETARGRLAHADDSAAESQDALARAVFDAAGAARALGAALSAASAALSGDGGAPTGAAGALGEGSDLGGRGGDGGVARGGGGGVAQGGGGGGAQGGGGDRGGASPATAATASGGQGPPSVPSSDMVDRIEPSRPSRPRRRPAPLPPAVFEESAAAAEHLVRVSGTNLLVDGYNVSLRAWPHIAIPEQRRRLIDALAELVARTGVAAQVVFDGAEQPEPVAPGSARSPVRVRFSMPDVDADEVLIELVDQLPPHQPVVVATSDRRVQDEVRRRGANVITTPQLLGLLGRAR